VSLDSRSASASARRAAACLALALACLGLGWPSRGWAQAGGSCGAISLQAGQIRTASPLTAEYVGSEAGKRCLVEIVAVVEKNRLVRAVTVSFRASDSERSDGKGLALARSVGDALVQAGLPRARVFAVSARAAAGEASGIVVRYTERAPDNVVARITGLQGTVRIGPDDKSLRPGELAMPILADDVIETSSDGQALLQLKDGSGIRLQRNTQIKMAKVAFADANAAEAGQRSVRVDVLRGQIEADVRKAGAGSSFEASSRVAVASVRGTRLRFGQDEAGISRLETLTGLVLLGSATDPSAPPVAVAAGQGALVSSEGKVEAPQPLPVAPRVDRPLHGPLPADRELHYMAVPGAAQYRVELARDADFLDAAQERLSPTSSLVLREPLPAGKWFFRVSAKNAAGFFGPPSQVYAFDVRP